jgi:hypothetical protein
MPSPFYSLLSAFALGAADLGVLALATATLGARPSSARLALLSLGVVAKLAVLVAGFRWLNHQAWFIRPWGMGGLLAPFALFLLWQVLQPRRVAAGKTS